MERELESMWGINYTLGPGTQERIGEQQYLPILSGRLYLASCDRPPTGKPNSIFLGLSLELQYRYVYVRWSYC
jgi:hypothetical protein